jgi:hypothetical protein
MTLASAARVLAQKYQRTWNLVLSGELEARQNESGRWMVATASVMRVKAEREAQNGAPAAA